MRLLPVLLPEVLLPAGSTACAGVSAARRAVSAKRGGRRLLAGARCPADVWALLRRDGYPTPADGACWLRPPGDRQPPPELVDEVLRYELAKGNFPWKPVLPWFQLLCRRYPTSVGSGALESVIAILSHAGRPVTAGNLLAASSLQERMVIGESALTALLRAVEREPATQGNRVATQVFFQMQRTGLLWQVGARPLSLVKKQLERTDGKRPPGLRTAAAAARLAVRRSRTVAAVLDAVREQLARAVRVEKEEPAPGSRVVAAILRGVPPPGGNPLVPVDRTGFAERVQGQGSQASQRRFHSTASILRDAPPGDNRTGFPDRVQGQRPQASQRRFHSTASILRDAPPGDNCMGFPDRVQGQRPQASQRRFHSTASILRDAPPGDNRTGFPDRVQGQRPQASQRRFHSTASILRDAPPGDNCMGFPDRVQGQRPQASQRRFHSSASILRDAPPGDNCMGFPDRVQGQRPQASQRRFHSTASILRDAPAGDNRMGWVQGQRPQSSQRRFQSSASTLRDAPPGDNRTGFSDSVRGQCTQASQLRSYSSANTPRDATGGNPLVPVDRAGFFGRVQSQRRFHSTNAGEPLSNPEVGRLEGVLAKLCDKAVVRCVAEFLRSEESLAVCVTEWTQGMDEVDGTGAATMASVLIRDLPADVERESFVRRLASRYGAVRQVRGFGRPDLFVYDQPDYCIVKMASGNEALAFLRGVNGTDPYKRGKPLKLAVVRPRKEVTVRRRNRARVRESAPTVHLSWQKL
ncbi:hypothetical protein DIPPA_32773 [Diplonema papillatum]|nr:hypothetical protein DIPPA_32773 [Diplonema papillatum]